MLDTTRSLNIDLIRNAADPLTGSATDYDSLINLVGDARFVLLGEASHGTHDFYRERSKITKRLICEKGFCAVAVEADWPDALRVNRYVQGQTTDADAVEALSGFKRFPEWMWRNADVLDFVGWLRSYNDSLSSDSSEKIGFYGLDLYSLHASIQAVLQYLDETDPAGATRARYRYACLDHFGENVQAYGYAAGFGLSENCESAVVAQLIELRSHAKDYIRKDGKIAMDNFFSAEQNARLIKNAERYYRTMFRQQFSSWNLRDEHMTDTLSALISYLAIRQKFPKVVVWAHNSHLGDARATQMNRMGEWNVGQLVRQRYPGECCLIGFTTHTGTVTAASNWDYPPQRKKIRPARPDSYEDLFHDTEIPAFVLPLKQGSPVAFGLTEPMLERAIGVVYRPESELTSHYFEARLAQQFDGVVHLDETRAVEPLEPMVEIPDKEPAETFPSGF